MVAPQIHRVGPQNSRLKQYLCLDCVVYDRAAVMVFQDQDPGFVVLFVVMFIAWVSAFA